MHPRSKLLLSLTSVLLLALTGASGARADSDNLTKVRGIIGFQTDVVVLIDSSRLRVQSGFANARSSLRSSLIQAQLAQDAAKTADIMNDLAVLAALENDAQLAKATANEAFNDRLAIFGDMSEQTAESLNTLGLASIAGMDYAEAQRYAMRALSIESGDSEKNALRIADSYDILAQAYFEEGDLVQAERLAKQALEIHSRALSPSNPASARDVFILANVELQAGHAAKAAELLEQSVDVSDDLQKTHSVLGLAIVAAAKGDMVHSRELFQRSINLAVRQFGDDSSIVVGMKALYVKVLWDQGRWIDALQVRGDLPDTRKTIDDLLVEDRMLEKSFVSLQTEQLYNWQGVTCCLLFAIIPLSLIASMFLFRHLFSLPNSSGFNDFVKDTKRPDLHVVSNNGVRMINSNISESGKHSLKALRERLNKKL